MSLRDQMSKKGNRLSNAEAEKLSSAFQNGKPIEQLAFETRLSALVIQQAIESRRRR